MKALKLPNSLLSPRIAAICAGPANTKAYMFYVLMDGLQYETPIDGKKASTNKGKLKLTGK